MKLATTLLAAAAALVGATHAQAQTKYPDRPITIIVPYAAGGNVDASTRLIADGLSKMWGQAVNVEAMPGGGTMIGTAAVKNAKPDGYTLGAFSNSFVTNPGLRSKMPYDTLKDFRGISMRVLSPLALGASADQPFSNFKELIEYAKKNPEKPVTYGTPGLGSGAHLAMELISRETGAKFQHVPYSGMAQAVPDLLGGRVAMLVGPWADQRAQMDAGKMKLVAAMGTSRLEQKPDVGTVGDVLSGFNATGYNGLVAPAGVPDAIIEKLSAGMKQVIASPEFKAKVATFGTIPWSTTPAETDKFIQNEISTWKAVAEGAKIKLD